VLENVKPTLFAEPSGDANNSFELWASDLDLARAIGLNAYRFSIEWCRIEPEPGLFSIAMLDHYKASSPDAMRGPGPVVTFSHWTTPRWFAMRGGWTAPDSAALFARFCDRAARHLADGMAYAVTLNEANGTLLGHVMAPPQAKDAERAMLAAAGRATGSEHFVGGSPISLAMEMLPNLIAAHKQGRAAIKATRPPCRWACRWRWSICRASAPTICAMPAAETSMAHGSKRCAATISSVCRITAASSGTTRASSLCQLAHRRRRLGDLPRLAGQCGRLCPCRNRLPDHGHRTRPQQRQ
jgi:hypothetical protein